MPLFKRQTSGSVVCTSCGSLVGVRDERCFNCDRRNPGMWGFAPLLRSLGNDLGFVQLVVWGCGALYVISLLLSGNNIGMGGGSLFSILSPSMPSIFLLGMNDSAPVFVLGQALRYALILGVMGLIMPGVDNFAHGGGFAGGYLAAMLLDPLKPERIDHIIMALICLAVTAISIAASVITGLAIFH